MNEERLQVIKTAVKHYDSRDGIVVGVMVKIIMELVSEVERLRAVLEFYAKPGHYVEIQDLIQAWPRQIIRPRVLEDAGEKARGVLAGAEAVPPGGGQMGG